MIIPSRTLTSTDIKEVLPKLKQDGTLSKQGLTDEEYDERL